MGVEAAPVPAPVGAAAPEPPLVLVTTVKGKAVQDVVGSADRVTISGWVAAAWHSGQVMVVEADSAA